MELQVQSRIQFRHWLQNELMQRCKRNPHYSLRSFAVLLDMDASSVSQIISGKRKASTKVLKKICQRLSVEPRLEESFLLEVDRRKRAGQDLKQPAYDQFNEDAIQVLSHWHYPAILELLNLDYYQSQTVWIANKLSLTVAEVRSALDTLERLKLIRSDEGRYVRTTNFLSTNTGNTSSAQKNMQREILRLALNAIDDVPQEEKDITGMTMAIDVDKLPEARKLITKFRRDLCTFLEDGERTRVYQLGIQLFPISKESKES